MVIKSKSNNYFLRDTAETCVNLRAVNMKLNPKKCMCCTEEGKFIGHVITKEEINKNPKKIQSLIEIHLSKIVKEVQALNDKVATLGHFLSKST